MTPSERQASRSQALDIWQAGVEAVESRRLVRQAVRYESGVLWIAGDRIPMSPQARLCVVGAGKAGAGMVLGLEEALVDTDLSGRLTGWVNVPADCVRPTRWVTLHAARPAGLNEPRPEGVAGAERILELVSQLGPDDVCLVLLSGGGSALLPAPIPGVTLAEKTELTTALMQAGATIQELNCVRKQISRIKGGGLARACRAGHCQVLIISDVIGDPLDVIASGPTVANPDSIADAWAVIERYGLSSRVADLKAKMEQFQTQQTATVECSNHLIGSNSVALQAAAGRAAELGFEVESLGSENAGVARDLGRTLAELMLERARQIDRPLCLLSGGEPVVRMVATDRPRRGGRNQELVLAAAQVFLDHGLIPGCLLSGGTDGEDGPTDAAGGVVDREILQRLRVQNLAVEDFLAINNSYPALESVGGLLRTGPTHTNVMDLRVLLVEPADRTSNGGSAAGCSPIGDEGH